MTIKRAPGFAKPNVTRELSARGWPRLRTLLVRALTRRCPNCGSRGIFRNWWTIRERCPTCGFAFAREDGYFLGAYALNLILAEVLGIAVVIYVLVRADLALLTQEIIALTVAIGFPLLLFPFSRTLWMALDLMLHPAQHPVETDTPPAPRRP